ncbi:S-methyl-5-thioribose-1-phosphate isomerase [Sorangium cellulosum]|uniref:Methylthioribose-1-phosphate isomerase n=1 Tax=Sorangium cellulosum So0157-2 TaxID=1254432 RepID=S4XQY2_SORCE|nr:S-methyl-5-thioribose-1-phosphate isomerase [Sorangium cellulosum]AGP34821.1 methylthioribose-1-phosphate isomerase [Sorangium cellulosum So0157-2]
MSTSFEAEQRSQQAGDGARLAPPWAPAEAISGADYSAVELAQGDDRVFLLEQRDLPERERYVTATDAAGVAEAIRTMVVRGAPAIGIAAAYGMALAARAARNEIASGYVAAMRAAGEHLASARPTAVNLGWAVRRALALALEHAGRRGEERARELAALAREIHREDVAACHQMARAGAARLPESGTVLTHCNAGALATGGYGTALGVIRAAVADGKNIRVLACETRPYLQGARLTAWELQRDGIPVEVISDSMAAWFMQKGEIGAVVVGADRIARNGDVANKIGTYGLACLSRHHGVPFYVAAPWSTIDLATDTGASIPIEERTRDEVAVVGGRRVVPPGVPVRHPAFDVTPAELITAIFTERGKLTTREISRSVPPGG